ncbi:hypothetical protein Bca52824_021099 [Brassica carinata]|uniref:Uncharacterized protein n=1 Tax=Brassica carinata TaxID=52824 RepID=A0A8X8B132_BRACI|nr:hypothetical protein Bca52824_021099 [Brassica carinata]
MITFILQEYILIPDGFWYDSFEAVGYDFNTIELSQMVRRVLSCFDSQEFFVAVNWSVEVNAYKPGDQCILRVVWLRREKRNILVCKKRGWKSDVSNV